MVRVIAYGVSGEGGRLEGDTSEVFDSAAFIAVEESEGGEVDNVSVLACSEVVPVVVVYPEGSWVRGVWA